MPESSSHIIPPRSAVPREQTWNLESVFPSDDAWEQEFSAVASELPKLSRFRGHLGDSPAMLADWFEAVEQLGNRLGKVTVYGSMNHTVDTGDQNAAANNDRARGLGARVLAAMSFAPPEMLQIGFDKLREWVKTEPRLKDKAHYFDRLERRQAHVRSAEVEELLSQLTDPFRTAAGIHSILSDTDLKFQPVRASETDDPIEIGHGNIGGLIAHPDRTIRKRAWENYADAYLAHKNTMANCIAAGVKQNVFMARTRRYDSALDAALTANFIPQQVFHNLIKTFRANLPTWHRYWRIRRRVLGLDQQYVYDTRAQLTGAKPKVSFEQAADWISQGMAPLGEEYVSVLRRGLLEQRWVDRAQNKGKRMGAFSTGARGTHPFIQMTFHDDIFSTSTLAHELGHSMHKYITNKSQPFVYSQYGIFLAECASNFNQAMVRAHLLNMNRDRDFQISIIEEAMGNFHRYFFIMPTLARFELEIHERVWRGEGLTADSLIVLMAELFSEGYGSEVEMNRERVGITWAQFPTHLYSNFYVYQYATGISAAHALSQGVLEGKPKAAENYLAFLSAGGSLFPLDALKLAGVDLTTPEPVEKTFGVLARMVDRLDELTK